MFTRVVFSIGMAFLVGGSTVYAQEEVFCTQHYQPVCGIVDGVNKTYGNSCMMDAAGAVLVSEGECLPDVPSVNIQPGQALHSPVDLQGNSHASWFGFEGQLGVVFLYNATGDMLAWSPMTIVGDWMHDQPVDWYGQLVFEVAQEQTGRLLFRNENPSGEPERDKSFEIAVTLVPQQQHAKPIEMKPESAKRSWWDRLWDWIVGILWIS